MIRIVTIHHESDRFLALQKKYLEKYTTQAFQVFGGYCGFTPPDLGEKFTMLNLNGQTHQHAFRLNSLATTACSNADSDDILIFMDSDTLPVNVNWMTTVKSGLATNPITAIQRVENSAAPRGCISELHPHPCFFATTVGFWTANHLAFGISVTAGYEIGEWLKRTNQEFVPILRSNAVDIHPLYFGVYGNILYHHGAGNRLPFDGVDICSRLGLECGTNLDSQFPAILEFNQKLSVLVFDEITNNDNFIRNFLMGLK